jgi:hypothetical protein
MPWTVQCLATLAAVFLPGHDPALTKGTVAACLVRKGMTEPETEQVLGCTPYAAQLSSLHRIALYPEYRLHIDYVYDPEKKCHVLTTVFLVSFQKVATGRRFSDLQALPLR